MDNFYEAKMRFKSNSTKKRQTEQLRRSTEKHFDNLNSKEVRIEDFGGEIRETTINVFTKRSVKTDRSLPHHQRFFISLEEIRVGEKIYLYDEVWIVLTSTNDSEVYYQGLLVQCNIQVEWLYEVWDEIIGDYQKYKAVESVAVYDANRVEGAEFSNEITIPDSNKRVIASNNNLTSTILRGETVLPIDDAMYRIIQIDNISHKGIKYLIGEEIQANPVDFEIVEPELKGPKTEEKIIGKIVIGPDIIYYGETNKYELANYNRNVNWTIDKGKEHIANSYTEGLDFYITLKSAGRMVGEEIVVRGTTDGLLTSTKTIVIASVL